MGLVVKDDGWRIPNRVWARMEPLLPEPPSHDRAPARRRASASFADRLRSQRHEHRAAHA
jgi:hypothetical protein